MEDQLGRAPAALERMKGAADAGAVHSRRSILEEVWDVNWYGSPKTLDVHVASLRRKLGHPEWIQAGRGVGFKLVVPGTDSQPGER